MLSSLKGHPSPPLVATSQGTRRSLRILESSIIDGATNPQLTKSSPDHNVSQRLKKRGTMARPKPATVPHSLDFVIPTWEQSTLDGETAYLLWLDKQEPFKPGQHEWEELDTERKRQWRRRAWEYQTGRAARQKQSSSFAKNPVIISSSSAFKVATTKSNILLRTPTSDYNSHAASTVISSNSNISIPAIAPSIHFGPAISPYQTFNTATDPSISLTGVSATVPVPLAELSKNHVNGNLLPFAQPLPTITRLPDRTAQPPSLPPPSPTANLPNKTLLPSGTCLAQDPAVTKRPPKKKPLIKLTLKTRRTVAPGSKTAILRTHLNDLACIYCLHPNRPMRLCKGGYPCNFCRCHGRSKADCMSPDIKIEERLVDGRRKRKWKGRKVKEEDEDGDEHGTSEEPTGFVKDEMAGAA